MMLTKDFFNEWDAVNKREKYKIICRFLQPYKKGMESKNAKLLPSSFPVFIHFSSVSLLVASVTFSRISHRAGVSVCFIFLKVCLIQRWCQIDLLLNEWIFYRKLVFIECVYFECVVNFYHSKFGRVREVLYYIVYGLKKTKHLLIY